MTNYTVDDVAAGEAWLLAALEVRRSQWRAGMAWHADCVLTREAIGGTVWNIIDRAHELGQRDARTAEREVQREHVVALWRRIGLHAVRAWAHGRAEIDAADSDRLASAQDIRGETDIDAAQISMGAIASTVTVPASGATNLVWRGERGEQPYGQAMFVASVGRELMAALDSVPNVIELRRSGDVRVPASRAARERWMLLARIASLAPREQRASGKPKIQTTNAIGLRRRRAVQATGETPAARLSRMASAAAMLARGGAMRE